jgi:hypothetical protein
VLVAVNLRLIWPDLSLEGLRPATPQIIRAPLEPSCWEESHSLSYQVVAPEMSKPDLFLGSNELQLIASNRSSSRSACGGSDGPATGYMTQGGGT